MSHRKRLISKQVWSPGNVLFLCLLIGLVGCQQVAPQAANEGDEPETNETTPQTSDEQWQDLFNGRDLSGWKVINFGGQEEFVVQDQSIVGPPGYPLAGIVSEHEDLPKTNYELRLDAQKKDGTDFFCCLTFPVGNSHCSLVLGGWGGTVSGISCIDRRDASSNSTQFLRRYDQGRWYAVRVRVTDDRLTCWLDDQQVVDLELAGIQLQVRTEVLPCRPLGLCGFETETAWKNIQLKRLQ